MQHRTPGASLAYEWAVGGVQVVELIDAQMLISILLSHCQPSHDHPYGSLVEDCSSTTSSSEQQQQQLLPSSSSQPIFLPLLHRLPPPCAQTPPPSPPCQVQCPSDSARTGRPFHLILLDSQTAMATQSRIRPRRQHQLLLLDLHRCLRVHISKRCNGASRMAILCSPLIPHSPLPLASLSSRLSRSRGLAASVPSRLALHPSQLDPGILPKATRRSSSLVSLSTCRLEDTIAQPVSAHHSISNTSIKVTLAAAAAAAVTSSRGPTMIDHQRHSRLPLFRIPLRPTTQLHRCHSLDELAIITLRRPLRPHSSKKRVAAAQTRRELPSSPCPSPTWRRSPLAVRRPSQPTSNR